MVNSGLYGFERLLGSVNLSLTRNDCVWITIARLIRMRPEQFMEHMSSAGLSPPPPGIPGIPLERVITLLQALGLEFFYSEPNIFYGNSAREFREEMRCDKVGVCYFRRDGSGHCVVYERVAPRRLGDYWDETWQYIDYQSNRRGRAVGQEVLASDEAFFFAIYGEGRFRSDQYWDPPPGYYGNHTRGRSLSPMRYG